MFERFTDRARAIVVQSQEEARTLNHNYIGTEHLLLGLIYEGEGVGAKALESLGISLPTVRQLVEEIIGQGQQAPSGHIPFTPRAKKVLELSLREAMQLGHNYIGTEHLLLGLIREGDGVAAQVLTRSGADLARTRQRIIELLHGYQGSAQPTPPAPAPEPVPARDDSPLGRWARAHAASVTRPEAADARNTVTEIELRVTVAGLPLLARAGITVPLALLIDLVRLTGGLVPIDARLRALASQPGVVRLRSLSWPPGARVALAGLLVCDLPAETDFAAPDAMPLELQGALAAELGGGGRSETRELRELREKLAQARRSKEANIDKQDFEQAAADRDLEKRLMARIADSERAARAAPVAAGSLSLPVGEGQGWQATGEVFDALYAAIAQITDLTITMLEILGAAAAAAEPTLPLRMRHRISSLPRIGISDRRLIMETVAISTQRSDVTAMAFESASGTTGVSRRGKITGLLPAQLALPQELLDYRHVGRELLYRVSEAQTQSPPETVTVVLDTTPATYGPPEVVLRLVAHVIAVTMWTVHKTPALVTLDRPGLARQIAMPADLVTVWTARSLEPPDVRAGLTTARRIGTPAILLTEHHAARDLGVIPHRGLRVLTTHVADDAPPAAVRSPFHVHLPPDPTSAQVIRAVRDLLEPDAARRAS